MRYCAMYFGSFIYLSSKIHCVVCQKKIILINFRMDKGIIFKLIRVYFPFLKISAFLEVV
jgi:hypothetical protein